MEIRRVATEFRRQQGRLTITQQNIAADGGNDNGSPAGMIPGELTFIGLNMNESPRE